MTSAMNRCDSTDHVTGHMCQGDPGHFPDTVHHVDLGRGRMLRWGERRVGCPDLRCIRDPNHELPHRDGNGRSWVPA